MEAKTNILVTIRLALLDNEENDAIARQKQLLMKQKEAH